MSNIIRIGSYRLGKTLGKGSFGKVKLAEHELTGHKVAVKILNRQKIKSSQMDRKIRREIKILKLFRHPHIIRLYEVIETPTDIFMVMEYVSGGELFDYIVSHGRLSEEDARRFFQQIISGVEYCHNFMVVHRDLKPENLLLDSDLNVKIADFGLSNIMEDGDFLKTSCGSPNYAAPEVISGKLYAGPEVDVWSCGVILYALLCGRLPFDEETIPNLFKKIKEGNYTIPPHVSESARNLINKILVVNPLQRVTIADIRKHPWFLKDLPEYLALPPTVIEKDNLAIDDDVLHQAVKKVEGFEYEQALEALKKRVMNEVTVAYFLLLDHKKRKMLTTSHRDKSPSKWPQLSKSPPEHITLEMVMHKRYAQERDEDQGGSPREAPAIPTNFTDVHELTLDVPTDTFTAERVWHLGLKTYLSPTEIMNEIYRVLKHVNMEWKVIAPFHLKCRIQPSPNALESSSGRNSPVLNAMDDFVPEYEGASGRGWVGLDGSSRRHNRSSSTENTATQKKDEVKVGLRIYKNADGSYLVDMRKLAGDMFPFLDACFKIYSHLRL